MPYTYTPLDSSRGDIRLLEFSVDQDGTIRGTLHTATLARSSAIGFSALSYLWGDPSITENILLDGEPLTVTVNLCDALRNITKFWMFGFDDRDPSTFRLWVDAICINQADVPERNHQVTRMAHIYQSAELVLSWLGIGDELTNLGLDTIRLIAGAVQDLSEDELVSMEWIEKHPSLCEDTWNGPAPNPVDPFGPDDKIWVNNEGWHASERVFRLPYWTRVWIFQETALARNIMICTGGSMIRWWHMATAGSARLFLQKRFETGEVKCPKSLEGTSIWRLLPTQYIGWQPLEAILHARRAATELYPTELENGEGWLWNPIHAEDRLIIALKGLTLRATDKKDHVYGLLSLSYLEVIPDYSATKSVGEVYADFASALLKFIPDLPKPMAHLFFLFYAGYELYGDDDPPGFPSWAPNFPQHSVKRIDGWRSESFKADCRVFCESGVPKAYVSGLTLNVTGVVVDTIREAHNIPSKETLEDGSGSLLVYFHDLVARNKHHTAAAVGSTPMLQQILRTVRQDASGAVDESKLFEALHLLEYLFIDVQARDGFDKNDVLTYLGLEPLYLPMESEESDAIRVQIVSREDNDYKNNGNDDGDGEGNKDGKEEEEDNVIENKEAFNKSFVQSFYPGFESNHDWYEDIMEVEDKNPAVLVGAQGLGVMVDDFRKLVTRWRFFDTVEGKFGLFGLGPVAAEPGDLVCVLDGSEYPVVLRKNQEDATSYTHIGVCFVIGLMQGEAAELVQSGTQKPVPMKLV